MIENIDRVLERGERIELLVDKTDRLNQQAFKFEKSVSYSCTSLRTQNPTSLTNAMPLQSRTLKNTMYYRKVRNIIIVVVIVAVSRHCLWFFCLVADFVNTLSVCS